MKVKTRKKLAKYLKEMISKKKQQDFVRLRWENILHHFEQFVKRTNAFSIHEIRVELKKLRALIFLQEESGNRVKGKEKALLKELFRQAGKVREAQVAAQLIKSTKVAAKEFLQKQKEHVTEESKALVELFRDKTDNVAELNIDLWRNIKPVSKRATKKIMKTLNTDIKKSYKPRMKQNVLHDSRKKIKQYVYIASLMKKPDQNDLPSSVSRLKRLEDAVGKWHDVKVTAGLLKDIPGSGPKMKKLTAISTLRLKKVKKIAGELF